MYLAQVNFYGTYETTVLSTTEDKARGLIYNHYRQWCKDNDEGYMKKNEFDEYYGVRVYDLDIDSVEWL